MSDAGSCAFEQFDQNPKEIYELVDNSDAWGFAAVFVGTGVKPE